VQQRFELPLVAQGEQPALHLELRRTFGFGIGEFGVRPLGEQADVDRLQPQFGAGRARQFEQRVDEFGHARGRAADAAEIVTAGVVELVGLRRE
jgi:hypothetical protein